MSVLTRPLTHADLAQFPDDGKRYEIIDGELYVAATPTRWHQFLLLNIYRALFDAVQATGWGQAYVAPVDVEFTEHSTVQPDLIVVRRDRLHLYRGNTFYGPPDLVVEVLSPSTRTYDESVKAQAYAKAGVPEFLLADSTEPSIRLFALRDGQFVQVEPDAVGRLHSSVVPGLVVDPNEVLAGLGE